MTYWHHLVPVFCCNNNSAPWWAQEFLLGRETAFPRASRILDPTAHWLLLRPSRLSCRFKMWPILNCRLFWTMRIKALSICHTKSLQIMQDSNQPNESTWNKEPWTFVSNAVQWVSTCLHVAEKNHFSKIHLCRYILNAWACLWVHQVLDAESQFLSPTWERKPSPHRHNSLCCSYKKMLEKPWKAMIPGLVQIADESSGLVTDPKGWPSTSSRVHLCTSVSRYIEVLVTASDC